MQGRGRTREQTNGRQAGSQADMQASKQADRLTDKRGSGQSPMAAGADRQEESPTDKHEMDND